MKIAACDFCVIAEVCRDELMDTAEAACQYQSVTEYERALDKLRQKATDYILGTDARTAEQ